MHKQITFATELTAQTYRNTLVPFSGIRFDVVMKPDCQYVIVGICGSEYVGSLHVHQQTGKRILVS